MMYHGVEEYLRDWPDGVSGGKGDGVAKDQLNRNNKIEDTTIARQTAFQDTATNAVKSDLSGTNGFDPQLLAAIKAAFLNQNASAYQTAGGNVKSDLAARGSGTGELPVGGDYVRQISELEGARAGSQSTGLLGLDIESLKQAMANKYNAANIFTGNAAQVGGTAGMASGAGSNALNTYVQAANTGFSNAFTTQFGGALGKTLGTAATGGFGQSSSSNGGHN